MHISQFFLNRIFALLTFAFCACCDWWCEIVLFRLRLYHIAFLFVCWLVYCCFKHHPISPCSQLLVQRSCWFTLFFLDDICVCVFSRLFNLSKRFFIWDLLLSCFLFFFAGLFALQYNNCTFFCLFVLYSFLIKNQFLCFYSLSLSLFLV